ncbi:hypothetical protein C8Q74DRAFT_1320447 [Fomes fomentarius]|nr:hypothetical protein C8Q74DRAFT_1320447 [Fomes fomentarius]
MHLIWENVIPNLIALWSGSFKGLPNGKHNYEFHPTVWKAIGEVTARAGDTKRYYDHFIDLVKLLHLCLQFELSATDIRHIREGFAQWVQKYEEFYYQYEPSRLPTCPVTIHALLHIADSIETAGPVWASWAFPMEHFCGSLQAALKSHRYPWASLNRHLLDLSRLSQIKNLYNLSDADLLFRDPAYAHLALDPMCILMLRCAPLKPDKGLLDKIIAALVTRFDDLKLKPHVIRLHLPQIFKEWAKLRILPNGDTIHATSMIKKTEDRRDQTYIRYETLVDKHTRRRKHTAEYELQTFYGRLEHIIAFHLHTDSAMKAFRLDAPMSVILGAVRNCAVTQSHPRLDCHYYSQYAELSIVDLQCIQCAVGRVPTGRVGEQWGIIDRSGSLARAVVIDMV